MQNQADYIKRLRTRRDFAKRDLESIWSRLRFARAAKQMDEVKALTDDKDRLSALIDEIDASIEAAEGVK